MAKFITKGSFAANIEALRSAERGHVALLGERDAARRGLAAAVKAEAEASADVTLALGAGDAADQAAAGLAWNAARAVLQAARKAATAAEKAAEGRERKLASCRAEIARLERMVEVQNAPLTTRPFAGLAGVLAGRKRDREYAEWAVAAK